jgi:group I intron endonuclease
MYHIYIIKNKCNNKVYIGQTIYNIIKRFYCHKCDKKGFCRKLFNAFNKHNRNNFYIELLTVAHTQTAANYWENYFIIKYNSIANGYNIRDGGNCGKISEETKRKMSIAQIGPNNHNYGKHLSKTQKQILSIFAKNRVWPDEHNAIQSLKMMGINNPFYGKTHSDEIKNRISATKMRSSQKIILSIINDLKSGQFTQTELIKKYGLSKSNISRIKIKYIGK